jgi:hypothetical protein
MSWEGHQYDRYQHRILVSSDESEQIGCADKPAEKIVG